LKKVDFTSKMGKVLLKITRLSLKGKISKLKQKMLDFGYFCVFHKVLWDSIAVLEEFLVKSQL